MDNKKFLEHILKCLQSMGEIIPEPQPEGVGLVKNDVLFAIIANNELYLRSRDIGSNYFATSDNRTLPFTLFSEAGKIINISLAERYKLMDDILRNATHSYWIASEKRRSTEIFNYEIEKV